MRLIQLSDLHFGTERPEVVRALIDRLQRLKPDLLMLSGDITQRARPGQFAACRRFLQRLPPVPILAVPGNHDLPLFNLWQRLHSPYRHFRGCFGHELAPVFKAPGLLVLGVNTTSPTRHVDGRFSTRMVRQVAARLKASSAAVKIVVGHHPVDAVLASDEANIAAGAESAMRCWAAAGMQLYLAGHIHYPFFAQLSQRYPGVPEHCWTGQAGTAVSHRVRDHKANSFNLVEWSPGRSQLEVSRWDFTSTGPGFLCVEQRQLPLRPGGSSSGRSG
ncbi:metallophosphoesterase family protein [Marinobacterium weihaiense]|uniref:Metallophosphoesterase n=1 Tax=Marinobacterium weihaiense TaxID=2851016 RepID=A0ABS6M8G3_9GAMM|nr:metallophosphoesterase family protein [Marinobacterium weihaiense]MBV0932573.1 metallophosphoesterase [Marinobacterium weihaiense]